MMAGDIVSHKDILSETAEISIQKMKHEQGLWFFTDQEEDEIHRCVSKKDGVVPEVRWGEVEGAEKRTREWKWELTYGHWEGDVALIECELMSFWGHVGNGVPIRLLGDHLKKKVEATLSQGGPMMKK